MSSVSDREDQVASVRVACCKVSPEVADSSRSAALTVVAIASAVNAGAQIIVLPELATSGYRFQSMEEARSAAVTVDGGLLRGWANEAARGDAVVVGGFCEVTDDGRLFNSSALVDGSGVLAVYRKLHLWHDERKWFSPGDQPAPVVQTRHGQIGLAVCYDLEFPELTRGLALQGAELIAVPTNWPHHPLPPDGRPVLHSLAAMTAYLNKVFVAVCDRCGTERQLEFEGGSVVAGPDGSLYAGPVAGRGEHTLMAHCPLSQARTKRIGEDNDVFADRQPEHYVAALCGA